MAREIVYKYLPKQLEFMQLCDRIPFPAYIGGYGSGKTHVLVLQILREAQRPSLGLVGAPTYRLLMDTTQRKFFELCPPEWIKSFIKSENKVIMQNGTEILFRTLDAPGRLTNLELSWFALDEVGEVDLDVYRMLQGRLRRPNRSHHGFCVGNPAGPTHWTYHYFVELAKEYPDRYGLVQASSYENTFLDEEYLKDMELSYEVGSLYYRRFVLGEFVTFTGAYWANFDLRPYERGGMVLKDKSCIGQVLQGPPAAWHFGKVIDFGYEHPFVCMWYATDGYSIVFFDEYYEKQKIIREHCKNIYDKEEEHIRLGYPRPAFAITDHDAQARAEIANAQDGDKHIGFSCIPAEKKVMESILLVQTLISQRRFYITEECKHARLEIPSYRAKPDVQKEQPVKENDDTCDCVRMACWMEMRQTPEVPRVTEPQFVREEEPEIVDFDDLIEIPR